METDTPETNENHENRAPSPTPPSRRQVVSGMTTGLVAALASPVLAAQDASSSPAPAAEGAGKAQQTSPPRRRKR